MWQKGLCEWSFCWGNWTFGIWAAGNKQFNMRYGVDIGPLQLIVRKHHRRRNV